MEHPVRSGARFGLAIEGVDPDPVDLELRREGGGVERTRGDEEESNVSSLHDELLSEPAR